MLIECSLWDGAGRGSKKLQVDMTSKPLAWWKLTTVAADVHEKSIIPLCADVTKKDELKAIAEIVKKDVGYINLLVANAGMTGPGLADLKAKHTLADFVEHVWKTPTEDFNAVYDLNCSAVFYTIIAFMELLDAGNNTTYPCKSQVVATASTASFLRQPRAGFAYTSSKAALVSLIKSFSSFCVPWGIRFNALAAGREYPSSHICARVCI